MKKTDPGMAAGEPERSSDLVQQFPPPPLLPGGDVSLAARDDKTVASEIQTLETCGYNLAGPFEFVGTLEINSQVQQRSLALSWFRCSVKVCIRFMSLSRFHPM